MAFTDLSIVSDKIKEIVDAAFIQEFGTSTNKRTFLSAPDQDVPEDQLGVWLYLYHITENPHYRNLLPRSNDQPTLHYTPMGLNLYYHLSARDDATDGDTKTKNEQKYMGIAMKALREYSDFTGGESDPINKVKICLQHIPPNEAINFWTAGDSPVKLSAYYEVSIVLLKPKEPEKRAGRVLSYGVHSFTEGAPRLLRIENNIIFELPWDGTERVINLQPAQATIGIATSPLIEEDEIKNNKIMLTTLGISGQEQNLLIYHADWDEPLIADNWGVDFKNEKVTAEIKESLVQFKEGTTEVDVTKSIIPGIYGAQLRITHQRQLSDGQLKELTSLSNQCPFAITPRIDTISDPENFDDLITITGYFFPVITDAKPAKVAVYVGPYRLSSSNDPPDNPGVFYIDPSADPRVEMQLRLPIDYSDTASKYPYVPLRIIVNDIESPPAWIKQPN